jgi:hypothetical protein
MTMKSRTRTLLITGAIAGGTLIGVGGIAGVAGAASTTASTAATAPSTIPTADPATVAHGPGETLLTGTTATSVQTAALAAVPGGTIVRVETDSAGSAYEAHVKKPDGTYVTVKLDNSFKVTTVQQGFGAAPAASPSNGAAA